MELKRFYNTINKELNTIIKKDRYFPKEKKGEEQKKSYAFLLWIIKFYLNDRAIYKKKIFDRTDDKSIDLIFKSDDIYYIVQAKWSSLNNCQKRIEEKDFKKTLQEFNMIYKGEILDCLGNSIKTNENKPDNSYDQELYNELQLLFGHIENSNKVKFFYIALKKHNEKLNDDIRDFNNQDEQRKLIVMDIDKIRDHYIDQHIKEVIIENPFKYQNPENEKTSIEIVRELNQKSEYGDFVRLYNVNHIYQSVIVLVKPKEIYKLVNEYGFSLFIKNIRNPLPESNINEDMKNTLISNPAWFWYFNNGVTAVTKHFEPFGDIKGKYIKMSNFHVINGAQTVYSVYEVYKKANEADRITLDQEVLITLRIIKSTEDLFISKITRYTNSQNPLIIKDFNANDAPQIKLQQQSYDSSYNIWYARRRGEFRNQQFITQNNIEVIDNMLFGKIYLSYFKKEPVIAISNEKLIFTEDEEGGYLERIFEKTNFEEIIFPYYIAKMVTEIEHVRFQLDENDEIKTLFDIKMKDEKNISHKIPFNFIQSNENQTLSNFAFIFLGLFDIFRNKIIIEYYKKNENDNLATFIVEIYKQNYRQFKKLIIYTAIKLIDYRLNNFIEEWNLLLEDENVFQTIHKQLMSDFNFEEVESIYIVN